MTLLDVLKCRRVLKDALAEELSIENVPIPDIEDRQSADRRDGVERDQEIHEGVNLPLLHHL